MRRITTDLSPAQVHELMWIKSGRSNSRGNCVELAELPTGEIATRNSRFPDGPVLIYTRAEMEAFIGGAKDGEFDHLFTHDQRSS